MALSHDISAAEMFWSKQASEHSNMESHINLLGIAGIIYVYSTIWYWKMQPLC